MSDAAPDTDHTLQIIALDRALAYPPRITAFTQRFWDALSKGHLETTACDACRHVTFPPKPFCPQCWSKETDWVTLNPAGTLYSWTRIHAGPAVFAEELPYEVGVVDLDDFVRIACRLWSDGEGAEWACGDRVRMVALDAANGTIFAAAREHRPRSVSQN